MSNLTGLLHEQTNAKKRLEQAIISGDYDEMTAIEKSGVELSRRIYFARRDDIAERLNDLRIEKESVAALQNEFADELKTAAAVVMTARNALYEAESNHAAIKAKQYFLDNQAELCRKNINETNAELNKHIQSRLNGIPGELPIDLMENSIC